MFGRLVRSGLVADIDAVGLEGAAIVWCVAVSCRVFSDVLGSARPRGFLIAAAVLWVHLRVAGALPEEAFWRHVEPYTPPEVNVEATFHAQPALVAGLRAIIADPAMTRSMREFATAELIGRVIGAYDLPRAEAERRAGLVAAHLLGVFTGRYLLELPALVHPSRAELVAAVGPVLQHYLDGEFGRPQPQPAPTFDSRGEDGR